MERQESRRAQMTKHLIRTALVELMEEKMLERITIKELCERADVNRSTFYLHYSDQRNVLNDIKETVCAKTVEMFSETGFDDPESFAEQFLCYVRDNDRVFRALIMNDEGDSFRYTLMEVLKPMMLQYLSGNSDSQTDAFGLAYMMAGSLSVIIEWMKTGYERKPKELAHFIVGINSTVTW